MYHADTTAKVNARVIAELQPIDMEEYFRDMLDDCYPPIKFGDMEWCPSMVLERVDPVAFRCGVSDAFDSDTMFEAADGGYYWQSEVDDIISEEEDNAK
jgi:hypothetical protein